jgi:hypothetical protein
MCIGVLGVSKERKAESNPDSDTCVLIVPSVLGSAALGLRFEKLCLGFK